jgi:molybdate/tungstate transport system substrate-binding protein
MAADYAKVSIHAGSLGTLAAKPIIYGLTIPASAPNAALGEKFVSFVLSPAGQAIMRGNGFVVISPALANPQDKVPASIKPLTTPWPSSGG